ncbi:MAG: ATP-binding cassette domain-containing protein [Betaproteobacteria bacterium]|nr:ATP-binding cassette domain-containing protein [Betaproteobacteria bacterium]MBU6511184.1 ATP-binding cassette domain-containing protein [Betaproteobacteria bacterium]MDE1955127.1 ATP-binding cassette domain-containing protein [Betaproteobacteria bacterium]MDE2151514.1 ATP-binding cassette domain-containing protein [Betaproteobacteria bacterium]MDE2479569.1 ATP-binding cassette domain-containing protein [Betaproteobacteria bacterium]
MDARPSDGQGQGGDAVIRARGLVNRFGATTVHEGVDLDLPRGCIMALVGGSGSGKSVLLRTLTLLRDPQAGSLELFGEDALAADAAQRTRLRTRIGVLFQGGALFSGLSVLENVVLALHEHSPLQAGLLPEVAMLKIGLAGLPADAAHKYPAELSGGMVKRAALARALALDPELLVLDEPTSGLDPVGAAAFDQLIAQLRELLGLTVLQVTHDLDSIWHGSDVVAFLARKQVLAVGSAAELAERDEPELREYFRDGRSAVFWRSARGAAPGALCSRQNP